MEGWLKNTFETQHKCTKPAEARYGDYKYNGSSWRCYCKKIWVFRTSWYFGEIPPSFHRTVPQWHKARWWERIKWFWIGTR